MAEKNLRTSLCENLVSRRLEIKKFFFSWWWLLLLGVTLFLRLPSLFEPFTYGDEGVYLTLGQALRKGLVFYRDIHDNKPPLLYLLAALAGNFSNFRLILFVWSLATIWLFFKFSSFVFLKNKLAAVFSTFIFAILTSVHTFEGNVANAENFMLLLTIGGFYLALKAKKWPQYFLAGILFSLATLFKVPAAFDFFALLIFLLIINKNPKLVIITIAGFLLPNLITIIYYAFQNALSQYLDAAFLQNLPYLSSWTPAKPKTIGLPLPLLGRAGLVLFVLVFLFRLRKRLSFATKLTLTWFSFSLFAAILSSRPYPHYLLQVMPPLALSFGLLINQTREKLVPLILSFALGFSFWSFNFWHYPNISYYQNFYQFLLKQKSQQDYFESFGSQTQSLYQTAEYLKLRTSPREKIFIWGNQPSLYALSNRLPVGRYTVAYHIIDFNGYEQTMEALKKNPPRFLVVSDEEKRPFPEFFAFIQSYYVSDRTIGNFHLFHRIIKPSSL